MKCLECGEMFVPMRSNSRFCNPACLQRHCYKKRRPKVSKVRGNCLVCLKEFEKRGFDHQICSHSCRARIAGGMQKVQS